MVFRKHYVQSILQYNELGGKYTYCTRATNSTELVHWISSEHHKRLITATNKKSSRINSPCMPVCTFLDRRSYTACSPRISRVERVTLFTKSLSKPKFFPSTSLLVRYTHAYGSHWRKVLALIAIFDPIWKSLSGVYSYLDSDDDRVSVMWVVA